MEHQKMPAIGKALYGCGALAIAGGFLVFLIVLNGSGAIRGGDAAAMTALLVAILAAAGVALGGLALMGFGRVVGYLDVLARHAVWPAGKSDEA